MGSLTGKGLELDKSDLKTALGQPPPEGLVPIGDMGIYISPHVKEDKPVSPFDCENYPDSPYCGGQPFTKTPVGVDLEFTANKCGVSITGTPILGFTKLPPISVAWIAPECRGDYPEQGRPPELPKIPEADSIPDLFFPNADENAYVLIVLSYNQDLWQTRPAGELFTGSTSRFYFNRVIHENRVAINPWTGKQDVLKFVVYGGYKQWYKRINTGGTSIDYLNEYDFTWEIWTGGTFNKFPLVDVWQSRLGASFYGKYKDIKELKNEDGTSRFQKFVNASTVPFNDLGGVQVSLSASYFTLLHFEVISGSGGGHPNPDDYKKRRCCEVACCDSGQAQQRQRDQDNSEMLALLREINKKLGNFPVKVNIFDANENEPGAQVKSESLSSVAQAFFRTISEVEKALKCIGIDQLPIYAPSSIIDDESHGVLGDLNDLKNQIFKQRIESIAEMMIWRAKNDNEIFGKWQEVITIEDSDPTKKGTQPKKVVLPNMARTFRELVLLSSTQIKVLGMLFDVTLKMYVDLANTKISTAVSEAILRDIQDYLDYPTEIKKLDVPIGISIPSDGTPNDDKEDLERFLRNSIAKAAFDDWTGEGSMTEMMMTLLRMAEGYLGQNFGKI